MAKQHEQFKTICFLRGSEDIQSGRFSLYNNLLSEQGLTLCPVNESPVLHGWNTCLVLRIREYSRSLGSNSGGGLIKTPQTTPLIEVANGLFDALSSSEEVLEGKELVIKAFEELCRYL